jgi:hypothetical protein
MRTFLLILLAGIPLLSHAQNQEKTFLKTDDEKTTIYAGDRPVLSYVHRVTLPPEGIDPLYKRSAYIHPLWSPGGERLTRIQPPDHYHHYGIWNPWTRTHFQDRNVDFWNLVAAEGTVRFAQYLEKYNKKERAGFKVKQEHIYFKEDGSEGIAINEKWEVSLVKSEEKLYVLDLFTTLNSPLEGGIILLAYRYGGGLGFRATERWGTENSTVLTSEGKTRKDADASEARWVIIEGESSVPEGRSGILFLSHPSNQSHPEPMRMWPPETMEGKENVFFEFCPIRHEKWVLEQATDYQLKYRMLVFDGTMEPEAAEKYWKEFSIL